MIQIVQEDITKTNVDVIVNAANGIGFMEFNKGAKTLSIKVFGGIGCESNTPAATRAAHSVLKLWWAFIFYCRLILSSLIES
jgi:hypothetical protein